jgi:hypothetical protein
VSAHHPFIGRGQLEVQFWSICFGLQAVRARKRRVIARRGTKENTAAFE